jgi:hypothetical protein
MRSQQCLQTMFSGVKRPVTVFLFVLISALPVSTTSLLATPPSGIPLGARDMQFTSSVVWAFENQLMIVVTDKTADSVVRLPRLANVVKDVSWKTGSDAKLQVQPEPKEWIIKPGAPPADQDAVLVVTLDGPPVVFDDSVIAMPDAANQILLPAKFAKTVGENLRFEPQPHKNTVGYWSNPKDTAHWQLQVDQPGVYEVDILQGCGKGHGGSQVEVQIENQTLTFAVQETGHFQNFVWRTVGKVTLSKAEKTSLAVVPQQKPGGAVMDVRAIRLVPAGSARSFDSELADPAALPQK